MTQEVDPSIPTTFLETCIKLLRYLKDVDKLRYLIDKCPNKENNPLEQCIVRKISKHKV